MKQFFLILSIVLVQKLAAQSDTFVRYQAALSYIKSNPELIRNEWKKVLNKEEWEQFRNYYKDSMPMRVSKKICFQGITAFLQLVRDTANGFSLPASVFNEGGAYLGYEYDKLYGFRNYNAPFLNCEICYDSLSKLPEHFLKISFSNSVDNYLVASIAYRKTWEDYGCNTNGKLLELLFVFNPSGDIRKVFFEWVIMR